jgi:2-polyprenyl-6-methoxyphenol hydroxylase-like FAD-dependent oxidoreductase
MERIITEVCVVGGGPASLALALCLVREGHQVTVLEQAARFDRTFRGESVSPDGVWLLDRLGVLDRVTEQGALVVERLEISDGGRVVMRTGFADFPYARRYPMEIPQPTLLAALAEAAASQPGFDLRRGCRVTDLVERDGTVTGVRFAGPDGPGEVTAELVVAADGRYSKVRKMSGLAYDKRPLERDFVWLRIPRPGTWECGTYRVRLQGAQHALFIPTYPDDLRVGLYIPKGGLRELRREGIGGLHDRLDALAPELSAPIRENVTDWTGTTVLEIFTVDVPQWSRPGLVLIGDAAHTLTPILGQGVNHALVDGFALAGMLQRPLEAAGARRTALVAEAVLRFQAERQASVQISRSLQLRQERAFTVSHGVGVAIRAGMYRALHRSAYLKRRILCPAYFQLQPELAS